MPRLRLRWTRLALADVVAARDYVAYDSPEAAATLVRALEAVTQRLISHPRSGRAVAERPGENLREVVVSPYRVVYRIQAGELQILRVWHARRSLRLDTPVGG